MLKKIWTNKFWIMCLRDVRSFLLTVALVSAVGVANCPRLAGAQGVDSYTKLMLHADGSENG